MPIQPGSKAKAEHFNEVANTVNRVYSDNYPNSTPGESLVTFTSDGVTSSYPLGSTITSNNFIVVLVNGIANTLGWNIQGNNLVFGTAPSSGSIIEIRDRTRHSFGWGNSAVGIVYGPTDADLIEASHVNALVNRTNIMSDRTGIGMGFNTVTNKDLILASDLVTIDNFVTSVLFTGTTKHSSVSNNSFTQNSMTRTSPWLESLTGMFEFKFDSYAKARHFFNAGNELKLEVDVTDDGTGSFFSWDQAASMVGNVLINYKDTRQTGIGGVSNCRGFYHLTDDWQNIFTSGIPVDPLDYSGYSIYYGYGNYCDFEGFGGYSSYGAYGSYGSYGSYLTMTIVFSAKYVANADGTFSVLVRAVLDNSMFSSNVVAGETTMLGGYIISNQFSENGLQFASPAPQVNIAEGLNSPNDS